jgi:thiol-disulfide isomerase/thioredoxin
VPYRATPARTDRIALAEFFTGAGCVPCVPVDYAFEAALENYSRRDLALLVYHMNAPTEDPMANHASEGRGEYYGVQGAPTVFLDGTPLEGGEEGEGDAATNARRFYGALAARLATRLEAPAGARVTLDARRDGTKVRVIATADKTAAHATLQIALVESDITYAGENGMRFWPMVVRALARPEGATRSGFEVDPAAPARVEYVFDTERIAAENLKYYDDFAEDIMRRVNIEVSFREKRNEIRPDRLSVVAFVQDDASKQILQAAYAPVASSRPDSGAAGELGRPASGRQPEPSLPPAARAPDRAGGAKPDPIRWSARVKAPAAALEPGGTFSLELTAAIDRGWHLYSPAQPPGGPVATRIAIPAGQPFHQTGEIEAGVPTVTFDPFFNVSTEYFEGSAAFTIPVTVAGDAGSGTQTLRVQVSFQCCNTTTCLSPRTVTLEVPVIVGSVESGGAAVGAEVPDFAFTDFAGAQRRFSEFRGKVVLVEFWATWCRPCLASIPHLKDLYAKYSARGFEILGMDSETLGQEDADPAFANETAERARQIVASRAVTWTQATSATAVPVATGVFGVESLPTAFLVGRDGRVVARLASAERADDAIERLLGKTVPRLN